jgi:hypothetical protein
VTDAPVDQLLFSYGNLQQSDVQLDLFGRPVEGEIDWLPGYTVDYVEVDDPRGRDVSGVSVEPVVRATGNRLDRVPGRVLHLTEEEVEAADEYQVTVYRREHVVLASGHGAWVYVSS